MKKVIKSVIKKFLFKEVFIEREQLRAEAEQLRAQVNHFKEVCIEREQLKAEAEQLRAQVNHPGIKFAPPGHYYSPLPSIEEIKLKEEEIFHYIPREVPGIDLNEEEQLELFNKFIEYYKEQPFEAHKKENLRYDLENSNFILADAIFLYCMIRYLRPKKIIEVGSGYSSCVILDTNEIFLDNSISCTFTDPYSQLLLSLIKKGDRERIEIIPQKLQDVDINIFSELSDRDILFIDSSHVSKINSDVNHIFFKILPCINSGVYVHFHDIGYPFEYPKEFVYQGIAWNEAYLLRAFLQYNNLFKIQFFNLFLYHFHKEKLINGMPLCVKNPGGSIWIKKI